MNEDKPLTLDSMTADEKELLGMLRRNPALMNCFCEMAEIADNRVESLVFGDDAEDATVAAMQKTAKATLQGWAERRHQTAEAEIRSDKSCRPHEKKSSSGKPQ